MRSWLLVVLTAALLVSSGASALAIPSLGGPTGIALLPTAKIAPVNEWQTAVGYRSFNTTYMYAYEEVDMSLWTFNALKGVASDAELWIAYTRATNGEDTDVWEYGGKYQLSERILPRTGFLAGTDIAIGASLGRWANALTNADPLLPFYTDTETLRAYFVVTTQLVPGGDSDWDWEAAPSTRIIGTAGMLYLRVSPDALSGDTLLRPFLGVEVIGQTNLTLALEYRFKDSGLEDDALFSALVRYPIDRSTNLEVGLSNASPIGLGHGDQDLFVRLGYSFPVSAY
ncbi:MAG: hypothetical protein MUQ65_02205 [Armatimonadetes bacterium]|nr:hypothetical protein [Armatimonadota bacterium]